MKYLRYALGVLGLVGLLSFASPDAAQATGCGTGSGTCFAIATGSWATGSTWSDTSGGSTCSATCAAGPVAGDAATLDSGTNGKTVTVASSASVLTVGGTCTCTLAINNSATLTVTGNTFSLGNGVTFTRAASTQAVAFTSTTGTSGSPTAIIFPSGATVGNLTFNGSGGYFQFQTNAISGLNSATITVTAGTLDTNNLAVAIGLISTGASGTLKPGSSTLTADGLGGVVWNMVGTFTAGTSTVALTPSGASTAERSFVGGAQTYNIVTMVSSSPPPTGVGANAILVSGANTFGQLTLSGPLNLILPQATTQTITTGTAWNGTAANPVFVQSATLTTAATIAGPTGMTTNWVGFENITFTGNAPTTTNCINAGGNAALLTCNAPSGGGGGPPPMFGGGL